MIAKIAYLTNPSEGRFILNFQPFGSDELMSIEVGPDHMRNILALGVDLMLRQSFHRVPVMTSSESANERAAGA